MGSFRTVTLRAKAGLVTLTAEGGDGGSTTVVLVTETLPLTLRGASMTIGAGVPEGVAETLSVGFWGFSALMPPLTTLSMFCTSAGGESGLRASATSPSHEGFWGWEGFSKPTNWICGRPSGFWIATVAEGPGVLDSVTVMEPLSAAPAEAEVARRRATTASAATTRRSSDDDDDIVFRFRAPRVKCQVLCFVLLCVDVVGDFRVIEGGARSELKREVRKRERA